MEDLIGLIVTIGVIFVWIAQNVFTGKRQAQQEFEEALEELEEEEGVELLQEKAPPSSPSPRPARGLTPPVREASKGAPSWEELQRQLQELLGAPSKTVPPPPRPPREQTSADLPLPLPPRERPSRSPAPRPIPRPMERRPASPPRPARVTRPEPALERSPAAAQAARRLPLTPSPHRKPAPAGQAPARPGKFPNLISDPLANAVLMGEVLRPYSRRRR